MKNNYTHMVFIMDRSGSMSNIIDETISGFNGLIKDQKEVKGTATITLAIFDDQYKLVHDFKDINEIPILTRSTFHARGYTALYDAIGKTINEVGEKLSNLSEDERPEKVIFTIFTDGAENASREFTNEEIKRMITHQESKYNWIFTFIGANIDSYSIGSTLGISSTNIANYTATNSGTGKMMRGASSFYSNARGVDMSEIATIGTLDSYIEEEK